MSTARYMRECDVTIGSRTLSYPPLNIEFEINFSERSPSTGKATLYNVSEDTVAACEPTGKDYPEIIINAGHASNKGTVFCGEVIKFETKKASGKLDLVLADKTSLWAKATVNKSWSGMISAKVAAAEILADVGLVASEMTFGTEYVYTDGLCFSGVCLSAALRKIAADTDSKFMIRNGLASFLPEDTASGLAVLLNYKSGLLETSKIEGGLKVKSLFLPKIQGGSYAVAVNDSATYNLKVKKGKHLFSCTGNAFTEFEGKSI